MSPVYLMSVMTVSLAAAPDRGEVRVADQLRPAAPGTVRIEGFLGQRIECNRTGRIQNIPMTELLEGFQQRPGKHAWIGEHIGKWLHAATLTWQYSGDAKLKAMIEQAVKDLLAAQKEDGYLGTYEDKERWTSWDVWVHKYNLIGLLTWYNATGDADALRGAQRIGDLLVNTFGPDKRDIIAAGTHKGMASTSVLEPMVLLYRATGDERHLAFCRYLVESWDQPQGPKVLSSLVSHGKVNRTANKKAYEMMSDLVGLCELYRVTADERYLKAARNAWDDIAANQLYITGGTSLGEHFQDDGFLPDTGEVAETCANVTWMQLSLELLALTGEAKYADGVEQLVYNHLLGAQAADGNDWCYFTVLQGIKDFKQNVNCCHSSGPRGVALIPTVFYATATGRLRINLYGESQFHGQVPEVGIVEVRQRTTYPVDGRIAIEIKPEKPATFRLELRIPPWSKTYRLAVNGQQVDATARPLAVIEREWRTGDVVTLDLDVAPQWIRGQGAHRGKVAARKGPLILCASKTWNPHLASMLLIGVEGTPTFEDAATLPSIRDEHQGLFTAFQAKIRPLSEPEAQAPGQSSTLPGQHDARVVLGPFALVQHEPFTVWLHDAPSLSRLEVSLLFDGHQAVSRGGHIEGSIADGDPSTYTNTCNGQTKELDWYEITLDKPVEIQRVVFRHGHVSNDGGWFDTYFEKPEVLVRTEPEGPWQPVGKLQTYPRTTANTPPPFEDGRPFELIIAPTKAYGVRVTGKPATGNKPPETFSSCAELAAYEK